jgi:hypothetical protein
MTPSVDGSERRQKERRKEDTSHLHKIRYFVRNNPEVFYEKRAWKYTWRMREMEWKEKRKWIIGELQWTS